MRHSFSAAPLGHMRDDAAGTVPPAFVAGHVGDREERLDRMHIRVQAAVGVELGELGVPRVNGKPLAGVPEALQEDFLRVVQQLAGAGTAHQRRRGCSEQYEGMGIRLLVGRIAAGRGGSGIPTAIGVIMQLAAQTLETRVHELSGTRMPDQHAQRIHMGHAAGNPGLAIAIRPRGAVIAQPV